MVRSRSKTERRRWVVMVRYDDGELQTWSGLGGRIPVGKRSATVAWDGRGARRAYVVVSCQVDQGR